MGIWFDRSCKNVERYKKKIFLTEVRSNISSRIAKIVSPDNSGETFDWQKDNTHLLFAIDGKIDNLNQLSSQLNIPSSNIADIVGTLYLHDGYEGLYRLEGAAAVILYDVAKKVTFLHRLFLRGLALHFVNKNERLTVCSNPVYLLHRSDVSDTINKQEVAKLFAADPTEFRDSVFAEIESVGQGELIIIDAANKIKRKKRPLKDIFFNSSSYTNQENLFEDYRQLLASASSKIIEPDKKYGIMLSSGMDSSTIAYFIAKHLKEEGRELTAYSWEFPGDSLDESANIKQLADKLQIPLKLFNAEPYWTFDELENISLVPDTPLVNLMWKIIEENYERASEDGADVLISGIYGDLLFRDDRHKLIKDILVHRRFDILKEIIEEKGMRGIASEIKRFLKSTKQPHIDLPVYLTNKAKKLIRQDNKFTLGEEFENYKLALGSFYTNYLNRDRYLSAPFGLERIEPYQNIELMNFSLHVPIHMTFRHNQKKYFTREAMKGLLPKEILVQPRIGVDSQLIKKSFFRNLDKVREKIWEDPSSWNTYIREEWMREKLQEDATIDNRDLYVIWLCITLTAWLKAIKPGGSLYEGKFTGDNKPVPNTDLG